VTPGETARGQLLQEAGYALERHILTMLRPDLEDLPDFPLPAGFEVRPVEPEHHRAIWDAHLTALRGHWGFTPPKPGDFEAWRAAPWFQPQLWQVAWHGESGEVAGQVKPYVDPYNAAFRRKRGYTEFISVGERWRRRGLARALIARALRAQRDAGMGESALGVDSGNAHRASRIYEDCGFREVKRNTVYRKRFRP
jgi:ribosomal protein S18 acetylase RimI-like enzyme